MKIKQTSMKTSMKTVIDSGLVRAVCQNHIEKVKYLLHHGADSNTQDDYGNAVLRLAVGYNHIKITRLLLQYGADPNIQCKNGNTILRTAIIYNHIDNVRDLLQYGADPNIQDGDGLTPLMRALCYNHIENVRDLLKYGAIIENIQTTDGRTTITCATRNGNHKIIKMVLNEAIKRRNQTDTMIKIIESIPYHVNKKTFLGCKNALNIDVMKHICQY